MGLLRPAPTAAQPAVQPARAPSETKRVALGVAVVVSLIGLYWLSSGEGETLYSNIHPGAWRRPREHARPDDQAHQFSASQGETAGQQPLVGSAAQPAAVVGLPSSGTVAPARTRPAPIPEPPAFTHAIGKGRAKVHYDYRDMGLDDLYGNARGTVVPKHAAALCELNLIHSGNCHIESGDESWMGCARRLGPRRLDHIVSTRCRALPAWQQLLAEDKETDDGWEALSRGWVFDSEIYADDADAKYVPPSQRKVAAFHPPRRCRSGCLQYPISFGVPAAAVAPRVSRDKWWGFIPWVPQNFPFYSDPTYSLGLQDEWLKDEVHRHSLFAFTHKRGGWDCMRHLEIMAAGAVPYFADVDMCPTMTLANYPKDLIKEAMALAGVEHLGALRRHGHRYHSDFIRNDGRHVNFKKPGQVAWDKMDLDEYFDIADRILNHTREHMTTASIVAYLLKTINYEEPKHVLMIGRWTYDYLHQTVENGLSDLGIRTTVLGHTKDWVMKKKVPPNEGPVTTEDLESFRVQQTKDSGHGVIPGSAWFFGFRNYPHVTRHANRDRNDAEIKSRISAGEFDLVIYTYTENEHSSRRPYWHEVSEAVPKERRIFLHHNDDVMDPDPGSAMSCTDGTLFKREMHDSGC
jgi:hypothetical protein